MHCSTSGDKDGSSSVIDIFSVRLARAAVSSAIVRTASDNPKSSRGLARSACSARRVSSSPEWAAARDFSSVEREPSVGRHPSMPLSFLTVQTHRSAYVAEYRVVPGLHGVAPGWWQDAQGYLRNVSGGYWYLLKIAVVLSIYS